MELTVFTDIINFIYDFWQKDKVFTVLVFSIGISAWQYRKMHSCIHKKTEELSRKLDENTKITKANKKLINKHHDDNKQEHRDMQKRIYDVVGHMLKFIDKG